ncbi:type II secretion system inner membrane protein GspF [bacterium]|nr:type II secretion system inner membrane protein GspF [bacterium]
MAVYEYKALNAKGKTIQGVIDATTHFEARSKLRLDGIFAYDLDIAELEEVSPQKRLLSIGFGARISKNEVCILTRQLATLLKAGLPLDQSLTVLIEQVESESLKKIVIQIREKVKEGNALSDALGEHHKVFPELYCHMVKAGEASGALDLVLERLASFLEQSIQQQRRIRAALAYPILMSIIGVAVIVFLMIFVIPTITTIFSEMSQNLPWPTHALISTSRFLRRFWFPISTLILSIYIILRKYINTESGKNIKDKLLLQIPMFGGLQKKIAISRFAQTMGTLIGGGLPILDALKISRHIVGNEIMAKAIDRVASSVQEGEEIASPLKREGIFPPIVVHMVSVGEKSGQLEEMLQKIEDAYNAEVQASIAALTSLLEPLIILVMGVLVGFIVISILWPIFEINQLIG